MDVAQWVVITTLVTVGMKLGGVITAPWWAVLAPAWVPAILEWVWMIYDRRTK